MVEIRADNQCSPRDGGWGMDHSKRLYWYCDNCGATLKSANQWRKHLTVARYGGKK